MKREFGKSLIEKLHPTLELTHIIDTSGAYIPGHGTPTAILFGRSRSPSTDTIRCVFGIRGEPTTPDDASQGQVWTSILRFVDAAESENEFVSSSDVTRTSFFKHPWSITGGGASEVKTHLDNNDSSLKDIISDIGIGVVTLEDDVFHLPKHCITRLNIDETLICGFVVGDIIRDWIVYDVGPAIIPHQGPDFSPVLTDTIHKWLWPYKVGLSQRLWFRKKQLERGLKWFEYGHISNSKFTSPLSIVFAFVASHNHFVFEDSPNVYKQTAPIIKLPKDATVDEHIVLVTLLNSSVACFWMKQVSHQRQMVGGDGVRVQTRAKVPYEYAGTQIQHLPLPRTFKDGNLRDRLLKLGTHLIRGATEIRMRTAKHAITEGLNSGTEKIVNVFHGFQSERKTIREQMVFLQEEIDFTCYVMFGLCDSTMLSNMENVAEGRAEAGLRAFEIIQQDNIDGFPVPSDIPTEWHAWQRELWQKRMDLIRKDKSVSVIEDSHYKRRWIGRQGLFNITARQDELESAAREWLLDRLESPRFWDDAHTLKTTFEIASVASGDSEFCTVASIYRRREDFDIPSLVQEIISAEAVPFLPALVYTASGLRKRKVWEAAWTHMRSDPSDEAALKIKTPPKYAGTDFQKSVYNRLRGKLDVPKERWISFPHCETESDPSLVVGWAGWNHLQQATALIAYYDARKREGWDAKRLTPLLAGLDQLLPWIHQWHPEVDPEFGETAGQSFQTMLESDAHELGLTLEDIQAWEPPKKTKTRRKRKAK